MSNQFVTSVDFTLPAERERELLDGYRQMNEADKPDGLLRSELLRGVNGTRRIQTTWRDKDAVLALRKSGQSPAALTLLNGLGAEHSHAVFTVEQSYSS